MRISEYTILDLEGRIAAMMNAKPVTAVRVWFVLVVSDLKPDPRAGDGGRGAGSKYDTTSLAWGERSRDWHPAWPSSPQAA